MKNITKKNNKKTGELTITLAEELSIQHTEALKKTLSEACSTEQKIIIKGKISNIDLASLQLLHSFSVQCKEDKKQFSIQVDLDEAAHNLIQNCNLQHILKTD